MSGKKDSTQSRFRCHLSKCLFSRKRRHSASRKSSATHRTTDPTINFREMTVSSEDLERPGIRLIKRPDPVLDREKSSSLASTLPSKTRDTFGSKEQHKRDVFAPADIEQSSSLEISRSDVRSFDRLRLSFKNDDVGMHSSTDAANIFTWDGESHSSRVHDTELNRDSDEMLLIITSQNDETSAGNSAIQVVGSVLDSITSNVFKIGGPKCTACHPLQAQQRSESDVHLQLSTSSSSEVQSSVGRLNMESERSLMYNIDKNKQYYDLLVKYIIPNENLLKILKDEFDEIKEFRLRWYFLNQLKVVPFTLELNETKHAIDYFITYEIQMNEILYMYFTRVPIPIELLISYDDGTSTLLGKCELLLKRAVEEVDKIYQSRLVLNNYDLCVCSEDMTPMSFGNLICRYSLKGHESTIRSYRPKTPPPVIVEFMGSGSFTSLLEDETEREADNAAESLITARVTDSELKAFQDGLNLAMFRNKALHTSQTEIANELKERTTWMQEELKWKLTLQEHAVLSGRDPSMITWRQWKDAETADVKYRELPPENYLKKDSAEFIIIIEELEINPESRVFTDDSINKIYVEYSFLNIAPEDLETSCRHKREDNKPLVYNFKNTFLIKKVHENAQNVANMVKNNESIVFTVVSEPPATKTMIKTCTELGSCEVSLFDLVQSHTDSAVNSYSVKDYYTGYNFPIVGILQIRFSGLLALRYLVLNVLNDERAQTTAPSTDGSK